MVRTFLVRPSPQSFAQGHDTTQLPRKTEKKKKSKCSICNCTIMCQTLYLCLTWAVLGCTELPNIPFFKLPAHFLCIKPSTDICLINARFYNSSCRVFPGTELAFGLWLHIRISMIGLFTVMVGQFRMLLLIQQLFENILNMCFQTGSPERAPTSIYDLNYQPSLWCWQFPLRVAERGS